MLPSAPSVTRCALYMRVSTAGQRERHTIDSQRSILPRLAESHGLAIHQTYIDDGISGESIEARPAFRQLLDDASAGYFSAVLVIDFDRLTRATDLTQLALVKKIFRDAKIKVITPGQTFDFEIEDHDFLSDLFGILAKHEKRKILSRTRRGIREKRQQGKWIMGAPPIPYYRDEDGAMLIDPEKKEIVLQLLSAGRRMGILALSRQYPAYRGLLYRMFSRRRLLFYAGLMEIEGAMTTGEWPPLIALEEAEEILQKKAARRLRSNHKAPRFLLTGLGIFLCGTCGRTVGCHSDSAIRKKKGTQEVRRYYRGYYQCNNRACSFRSKIIPADRINELVLRRMSYHLARIETIQRLIDEAAAHAVDPKELAAIERKLAEEEAKRKNLIQAVAKGVFSIEEVKGEAEAIRGKIASLRAGREALVAKSRSMIDPAQLHTLAGIDLSELTLIEQREVVAICIERITLYQNNLYVFYRFPINQDGKTKERITRVR